MFDGGTNRGKGGATMAALHAPGRPLMVSCLVWPDHLWRGQPMVRQTTTWYYYHNYSNLILQSILHKYHACHCCQTILYNYLGHRHFLSVWHFIHMAVYQLSFHCKLASNVLWHTGGPATLNKLELRGPLCDYSYRVQKLPLKCYNLRF